MATTRRVPLVLFLIADTGGGHRSAANAIRSAMDLLAPESFATERPASLAQIDTSKLPFSPHELLPTNWGGATRPWRAEIRDIFEECGLFPLRRTARLYGPTVEKSPAVYSSFYHVTNTRPAYAALSVFTQSMLSRGLMRLFEEQRPDVIVSVHPLLTHATLNLMGMMGVRVPFITVVTDLIRFHRAWAEPDVDVCSVPTEEARQLVIELGMDPAKIRLLGMPIHPKFSLSSTDSAESRCELGLAPERFTVLMVGGGDGIGGLGEAAITLAASNLPIQLIVVTGRNRALYHELTEILPTLKTPMKVLGFVNNMPDLMRAADVIVTKAGPGTIMEALSRGLPIILTSAIPGQEVSNISFVEENQVGELARTPEAIVDAVQRIVALSPAEREEMSARARALSKPEASFDIAQLILSYVPTARSISAWNQTPRLPVYYVARRPRRHGKRRSEVLRRTLPASRTLLLRKLPFFASSTKRRRIDR